MTETVAAIAILASAEQPAEAVDAFASLPGIRGVLSRSENHAAALVRRNLRIDMSAVPPAEYGAAQLLMTGSPQHYAALRALARDRGLILTDRGLFDGQGRRLGGATEEGIYRALGLDWIPPELRENSGDEIEAAAQRRLPGLVSVEAIRGDLHVHTNWSDGRDSPARMVEAAIARGLQYVAITDHSRSLRVAGGLSVERVRIIWMICWPSSTS
jgi:DNA polymerase (family 10)